MAYEFCPICGYFDDLASHECDPEWQGRFGYDDEGEVFQTFGHSEADAAELLVEQHHDVISNGSEFYVEIRKGPEDEWKRYDMRVTLPPLIEIVKRPT